MSSFYTSLNGLKNAETDLGVLAHNIANSESTGFKKSGVEFADVVGSGSVLVPQLSGATVTGVTQDFSLGPIEQTGRGLDVAIDGDGFFGVRNHESGELHYTRNGHFRLDEEGHVTDFSNKNLMVFPLDEFGEVVPGSTLVDAQVPLYSDPYFSELSGITFESNGMINATFADGTSETVGRLALATFIAPGGLRQAGDTKWQATASSGGANFGIPGVGKFGNIRAGGLERSNVNIAEEMVGLITAQRNFQANAKAIDTASQISQTIINLRS